MRLLTQLEASAFMLKSWGSNEEIATSLNPDPVIAEYLRAHLCRMAMDQGTAIASKPVYITALLNQVRRQLRPVWPGLATERSAASAASYDGQDNDETSDPVRRVLDELQTIR